MKVCNAPAFEPVNKVYINKRPVAASSTDNAEIFATTIYSNLMLNERKPFAIVSIELNTLDIDQHGMHNTVLVKRKTLGLGSNQTRNVTQRSPVEDNFPTDLDTNGQNTQTEP